MLRHFLFGESPFQEVPACMTCAILRSRQWKGHSQRGPLLGGLLLPTFVRMLHSFQDMCGGTIEFFPTSDSLGLLVLMATLPGLNVRIY